MTLSEQYAAWLAAAMRSAGLDIDRQRGGGRKALAQAIGVSPTSVARWLDGKAVPSPEFFEPIANAVGVPVITMLVESGIISAESLNKLKQSDVRSQPITPEQAADELGLDDPEDRARFTGEVASRTRRHLRSADSDGETGGAAAQ